MFDKFANKCTSHLALIASFKISGFQFFREFNAQFHVVATKSIRDPQWSINISKFIHRAYATITVENHHLQKIGTWRDMFHAFYNRIKCGKICVWIHFCCAGSNAYRLHALSFRTVYCSRQNKQTSKPNWTRLFKTLEQIAVRKM